MQIDSATLNRTDLARRIFEAAHITGEFKLRSGAVSNEYFDKYLFESDPQLLADIARALSELVPDDVDALAGLEMGGIPLATMLSQITRLPALFVRKEAKPYGTRKLAEGGDVDGRRLLIVEDVVTSGGQIVLSANDLRQRGARVEHALCVIDRQGGGAENLAEAGLTLHPLFTMSELKAAAAK
ncbi:MAG TPA: orotate phosphoribosyltransferase [Candidatus Sulfomarinibacteraceae bacterium]|nr:orotate phosphoribosyltransferase [Candidatus Sulfomarinibacteraceae bacterium]